MGFSEDDRIRNKQRKYLNIKANKLLNILLRKDARELTHFLIDENQDKQELLEIVVSLLKNKKPAGKNE